MRQRRLTPHPIRGQHAPALTDGDTHTLHHAAQNPMPRGKPPPNDLLGSYKPSQMLPCASRTWLYIRRGKGINLELQTRHFGGDVIRLEQRAAEQNERPLQQAQGIVRLPGVAATPAHTHTHATPARQSWMSARRYLSKPLLEMAIPLVFPGRCVCTRVYLCSTAVTLDLRLAVHVCEGPARRRATCGILVNIMPVNSWPGVANWRGSAEPSGAHSSTKG